LAAVLAEQGFTGPAQIFDGPRNVFAMFDAESDPVALADGLGLDFELTHNTMKMYACAGWRNPIIEAVVALMDRDQLDAADIDRINVVACRYVSRLPNYPDPQSGLEAKFSAEHAAAVAAVDRAGGLVQFEDARATDPAIATLRRKVVLEFDDQLDDYAIRLAIRTSDGQEHATSIPIQKGDYRNPMTSDEVLAKFERNAATVLPPANVGALTALLPDLDSVDDIVELTVLCRAGR
jgi:2-methylcitrate dehydratase PrpD